MRLSWPEIRANAAHFATEWRDKGYEKGQTHSFYDEFFRIFGVPRKQVAVYEQRVRALDPGRSNGFIDLFWPGTLIVEQKSMGRDLTRAMTQALDYYDWLPESQRPRHMMVCDFQRFELFDLETRREWRFPLTDLKRHVEAFGFILGVQPRLFRNQSPVNRKASELMGRLHNALAADGYTGHDLERLLVRLLFILFADDTGIFERKDQFLTFLEQRTSADGRDLGRWLGELFQTLDTPPDRRQQGLDPDLAEFPYINGELFRERIAMPSFDHAMRTMLLDASMFHWGDVSPAIFGSLFESVIDSVTRRRQGAHYTPEQAILKVIEPLFLDDLRAEFARAKGLRSGRIRALRALHDRLGTLAFLDPACGAGNFLVVAYRELRELEREILKELLTADGRVELVMDVAALSKLDVDRFFGIEVDEFPAMIAQVALWMTDHIANTRLAEDFGQHYARIPLVKAPGIRQADALDIDWNDVVPAERCSYVFGNPPFVGHQWRSTAQQKNMAEVWGTKGQYNRLDFVTCWFRRGLEFALGNPAMEIAFVSTNSITQGEQAGILWPYMFAHGGNIIFAHRTFAWNSPGVNSAAVHCVVIGFSRTERAKRRLFEYATPTSTAHEIAAGTINGYLIDAPPVTIPARTKAPVGMAPMHKGSQPTDGARIKRDDGTYETHSNLILDAYERRLLIESEPELEKWLRPFVGGDELISGTMRWCLWLKDVAPAELRKSKALMARLQRVKIGRLASPTESVRKFADYPWLFTQDRQPSTEYIAIPEVSSENRDYIPIAILSPTMIASNKLQIIPVADLYVFGLLTSSMHMGWMKTVSGRLKNDFSYSPAIYNTFPWPEAADPQRTTIESLAQAVLDARALPQNATSSLADLYDPDTMPAPLRRAHRDLDHAVERLYRKAPFASDRERVEHLFTLYQHMIAPLNGKQR